MRNIEGAGTGLLNLKREVTRWPWAGEMSKLTKGDTAIPKR